MLIRADSSAKMGTGHIMRCFALAQGWQSKGGKASKKGTGFIASFDNNIYQYVTLDDIKAQVVNQTAVFTNVPVREGRL